MTRSKAYARRELARTVALEAGLNLAAASRVVDAVIDRIRSDLVAGERVVFRDFGTFVAVDRAERKVRDFRTGGWKMAPARRAVRFIPSPALKRAVNAEGRD